MSSQNTVTRAPLTAQRTQSAAPAKNSGRVARYVILTLGLIFALTPIYWMFASALKSNDELGLLEPTWFPRSVTFDQFATVLANPSFLQSLMVSATVALVTTVFVLVFGSLAAYAVTHWKFRASHHFVTLTLFTQLLPQAAVVVPLYLLWNSLGLVGSGVGLGIAYFCMTLPVGVWMMVGFFKSIPVELSEAALVDGASRLRTLVSVILPVARPGISAVGVYTIITCWGEFLFALVLLSGETQTATVNVGTLIGEHNANIGPLMAAAALATLPPLILFFFLQKHFVAGLTGGSVK